MANITFTVSEDNTASASVDFEEEQQLIKEIFGYETVETNAAPEADSYSIDKDMDEGKDALLGNPIFMPLVFEETTYNTLVNGEKKTESIKIDRMFFPVVMIEASRSKVIEVTTIEGRNGTIKEFSNLGDYEISIKGTLVGNEGNYPTQQVQHLIKFENCPVAIPTANDFLKYIGVNGVVIKRISWRNNQGYENMQAFELECMSDADVKLNIEEKK